MNAENACLVACLHFLPAIIDSALDGIHAFFGANRYLEGNWFLIIIFKSKNNQDYSFVVKEHYEEYHSLADKCLMYLINLILFGVLGHNISYI